MNTTAIQATKPEKSAMEYIPFGSQDKIKLSLDIIKNLVAVKTKTGQTCNDQQALRFMMLCQAQRLNPFAGDAYLIGYDTRDGAQFSLVTAHQAFLKRAEVSKDYDGMQSGIIVRDNESGDVSEIEGDFFDKEKVTLLGGWAIVYHKQRKIPTKRRVRLERFQKSFGVWVDDPAGMICKCAEADALRSTFPTMLGGLYIQDEMNTATVVDVSTPANRLVAATTEVEPTKTLPAGQSENVLTTPNAELETLVLNAGYTFDLFQKWGVQQGHIPEAMSLSGFGDIKADVAKRLLRAKTGLLQGLEALKEAQ